MPPALQRLRLEGEGRRTGLALEPIDFVLFVIPLNSEIYDKQPVLNFFQIHCGGLFGRKARVFRLSEVASRFFGFPAGAPETTPGAGVLPGKQRHQRAGCPVHLS